MDEFLIGIRGQMNDVRRDCVTKAYNQLDKDDNGFVSKLEIKQ